ncbi:MAG: 30S ribosomal protein S9 [Candidatus Roizmanbacteria bacterium]|nr:30S ribosomal protein S9 [Candidatus Roizmanbacteria bacterium]
MDKTANITPNKQQYYQAVGRRREASAQVRLYPLPERKTIVVHGQNLKAGDFVVNKKDVAQYFPGEINKVAYRGPLHVTKTLNDYAVSVLVYGGGKNGQLDAVVHGIARALDTINRDEYRPLLKKSGFLTRDPRVKERRKAGLAQKARAKKSSPKR